MIKRPGLNKARAAMKQAKKERAASSEMYERLNRVTIDYYNNSTTFDIDIANILDKLTNDERNNWEVLVNISNRATAHYFDIKNGKQTQERQP